MHLSILADFAGRFHPVVVHLPIGILVMACCFDLISVSRFSFLRPAVPTLFFWGMVSAILAVITGLALFSGGEYEKSLVDPHKWSGLSLAGISVLLYAVSKRGVSGLLSKLLSVAALALLVVTGHLGGTITHGEGYLTGPLTSKPARSVAGKPIPNIQQAFLYADIVQPLFQSRCYGCHSSRKQKGKLRLDIPDLILKGGESGKTVVPGKSEESKMIENLLLPLDDDDHMPPKGKTQLSPEQIEILKWWVENGADFHKRVNELQQPAKIQPVLIALQAGKTSDTDKSSQLPEKTVLPGDARVIAILKQAGVMVSPVAIGSNYLSADFVTVSGSVGPLLEQLKVISKQLVTLRLDGALISDGDLRSLSSCPELRELHLANTAVSDRGMDALVLLQELRYLSLTGTGVTAAGVTRLAALKKISRLYLYKTAVKPQERPGLTKLFPNALVDFGDYRLPTYAADTTEIKY